MGRYFEIHCRSTFCVRWVSIFLEKGQGLKNADHKVVAKYNDWQDLVEEIHGKLTDSASTPAMKRLLGRIQPLPRLLSTLTRRFASLVAPSDVRFDLVWGLIYLNLKVREALLRWGYTLCWYSLSSHTLLRIDSNGQQRCWIKWKVLWSSSTNVWRHANIPMRPY